MKKILLSLVFAIGLICSAHAQTKTFCFTDGFGYSGTVTATWAGYGDWTLSGDYDVFLPEDWIVSGYLDKVADQIVVTVSNPSPDGCTFYTDYFEFTSTGHGGMAIDFDWASYCPWGAIASGTGTLYFSVGPCVLRTAETDPHGPAMANPELASITAGDLKGIDNGVSLFDLLVEPELNVVRNNENNFEIGYDLTSNSEVTIDIYNQIGQYVATVVSGNQTAGMYKANWDASEAQNGMYVVVMRSAEGTISKQFVK